MSASSVLIAALALAVVLVAAVFAVVVCGVGGCNGGINSSGRDAGVQCWLLRRDREIRIHGALPATSVLLVVPLPSCVWSVVWV